MAVSLPTSVRAINAGTSGASIESTPGTRTTWLRSRCGDPATAGALRRRSQRENTDRDGYKDHGEALRADGGQQ
jgi:hypothetical protein